MWTRVWLSTTLVGTGSVTVTIHSLVNVMSLADFMDAVTFVVPAFFAVMVAVRSSLTLTDATVAS